MDKQSEHLLAAQLFTAIGVMRERAYPPDKLHNKLVDAGKYFDYIRGDTQPPGYRLLSAEFVLEKEGIIGKVLGIPDVKNWAETMILLGDQADGDGLVRFLELGINWCQPPKERAELIHSLRSPFSILQSAKDHKKKVFLRPRPLALEKDRIFPSDAEEFSDKNKAYQELFTGFSRDFDRLPTTTSNAFLYSLLFLIKKYTWSVPSVFSSLNSLYEQTRLQGAISTALWKFSTATNSETWPEEKDPLVMLGLDLSGIQNFIYQISSSKAYKSLKGRSFYLSLLLESMIESLLQEESIAQSRANVVYSSGGMAYLLLPAHSEALHALLEIRSDLERRFWQKHKGVIYPAMDWVSFRYANKGGRWTLESNDPILNSASINELDLGQLWKAVSDKTAIRKRRKFQDELTGENFSAFFGAEGKGLEDGLHADSLCAVTGEPIIGEARDIGKEEPVWVSSAVYEQTLLGDALKDSDFLYSLPANGSAKGLEGNKQVSGIYPLEGDWEYFLVDQKGRKVIDQLQFQKYSPIRTVLNHPEFLLDDKTENQEFALGFAFYGGNRQPEIVDSKRNRSRTLEELCFLSDEKGTYTKLAILRMDVDNLGQLFVSGIPSEYRSFATYASLSFSLDLFFSGWLNLIRNEADNKDHIAILYSGGDDLFIVGRWDRVIDFAQRVRSDFAEYTGRKDLSISGGIVLTDRKYPIYKGAELAGEAEQAAKQFREGAKNAITLFGQTVGWDSEFDLVVSLKEQLVRLIEEQGLSRGILHQLQRYKAAKDFAEGEGRLDLSYVWHGAYYLKRLMDRHKKKEDIRQFLEGLIKSIVHHEQSGPRRFLDLAAVSARWAEYEIREIKS